jgi:chromosome segregation ATPase
MKIKDWILIVLCSSLIAGCATVEECDPTKKLNLFTKMGCTTKYGQRQDKLEATIQEELAISESLKQIYALLQEEQKGVSGNLADLNGQYKKLNDTLNDLIAQISARSSGNKALQQQIAKLQQKQAKVNNYQTASDPQKQLALNALYAEVENLKTELGYD